MRVNNTIAGSKARGWAAVLQEQSAGKKEAHALMRFEVARAGDGIRTREYQLGRLMPYHLATPAGQSGCADSNRGPTRPKRGALPTAPHPEDVQYSHALHERQVCSPPAAAAVPSGVFAKPLLQRAHRPNA